eukprot:6202198-Pleurochrysis_carterae.AAC.2
MECNRIGGQGIEGRVRTKHRGACLRAHVQCRRRVCTCARVCVRVRSVARTRGSTRALARVRASARPPVCPSVLVVS